MTDRKTLNSKAHLSLQLQLKK